MPETIRRLEEKDLKNVSILYGGRKTTDELRWLFTDPEKINDFNAFVAVNESDEILGVIGYSLSVYTDGEKFISGVISMSWKIADHYKGFAGVQLFKRVISIGEFGIAIGGSETAQQLYSMFKYTFLSNSYEYYKLLHPKNALLSLKRKTLIKSLGMVGYLVPSYLKTPIRNHYTKEIKILPYSEDHFVDEPIYNDVFRKKINKNYINWLLKCPKLKTYAFKLYKHDEYLGNCVLYVKKVNGFNRGRIVHLPFLGFDKDLWAEVINVCVQFFRSEQCCLINGIANHSLSQSGFTSSGFTKQRKQGKPVFIKESMANLKMFDLANWYLQYSEGDKAYRDL